MNCSRNFLSYIGTILLFLVLSCESTEETRLRVIVSINGTLYNIPAGSTEPLNITTENACNINIIMVADDTNGVVSSTIIAESGAMLTRTGVPGAEQFDAVTERSSEPILPTSLTAGAFVVPTSSTMVFGFSVESQGGEVFTGPSLNISVEPEEGFECLGDTSAGCSWDFTTFAQCEEGETMDSSRCFVLELDPNEEMQILTFSKNVEPCIAGHEDLRVSRFRVRFVEGPDDFELAIYRNIPRVPNVLIVPEPNVWVDNRFEDWTINANWIFEATIQGPSEIPEGLVIDIELD